MPQPKQQQLSPLLWFDPDWVSDPGPEIWRIISGLDVRQQVRFAERVLDARISVAEAHVEGMRQLQKAIGEIQG
jgi:hypothetical protein